MVRRSQRRLVVDALKKEGLSLRKACGLTGISLPGYQYQPQESELNMKILENMRTITGTYKSWGLPTIFLYLRRIGYSVNRKRVHRIYKLAGLQIRKRRRREKRIQERTLLGRPDRPNQRWSMDFIHDSTAGNRKLKCLIVVDDYTREALAIEVARSIPSQRVCLVLERLIAKYGRPEIILTDNGPEFVSGYYALWALTNKIRVEHIEPGKPNQNAFAEAFNSILRAQCLNQNWFLSLEDAERIIEDWRMGYNQVRPHGSLAGQTPEEFRMTYSGKTLNQIELQKGV
jgi:putative transposase